MLNDIAKYLCWKKIGCFKCLIKWKRKTVLMKSQYCFLAVFSLREKREDFSSMSKAWQTNIKINIPLVFYESSNLLFVVNNCLCAKGQEKNMLNILLSNKLFWKEVLWFCRQKIFISAPFEVSKVKIKKGGVFFGNKKTKVKSNGIRWLRRNRKKYDCIGIQ